MIPRGFDTPLYVLPFDHRGSFQTEMFGWKGALTPEQTAQIAAAKQVIYDGFKSGCGGWGAQGEGRHPGGRAVRRRHPSRRGSARLRRRRAPRRRADRRSSTSSTARTSPHTSRLSTQPSARCWCATTREGDQALNRRQAARLNRLSDYLQSESRSLFMFELLVPPQKAQLKKLQRRQEGLRPGAAPATDGRGDPAAPGRAASSPTSGRSRDSIAARTARRSWLLRGGVIVTKSAASSWAAARTTRKVREWLMTAAGVPGFIGFAVGRTDFWEPLVGWLAKKITRDAAVAEIAHRYREFVSIFESARVEPSAV